MSANARAAYFTSQSAAVPGPYLVIGVVVLVWMLLIGLVPLPSAAGRGIGSPAHGTRIRDLLRNKNLLLAIVAQFFYVGAQVGIWSYLIRYAQQTLPKTSERNAADFLTVALVMFMIGRFAGTGLMRYLPPARLLAIFASVALPW